MKKTSYLYFLTVLLLFFAVNSLTAQDYGISLNTEEATDGFVLFQKKSHGCWLINNCGEVVNSWPNVDYVDFHPKFLDNGNLIYQKNNTVYEKDWDSNTLHSVSLPPSNLRLVYEVIKLENGNYLSVGRRSLSNSEFIELGYDLTDVNPTQVDVILELDGNTGEVVWLWDLSDHIIQERDPSLSNYGIIADHPELLNMDALSTYDWNNTESFMINGMDYNPELDQIAISVRKMSEVVIIDHSTTTAEAAGHTGGNHGKGGDVLFRWGNPQNYGQGDASDRFLYLQHNPKWITSGPNQGKLTCYNNGLSRPDGFYSQVPILTLPIDSMGFFEHTLGTAFGPAEPDFIYGPTTVSSEFYSPYTSGARMLSNGNIYITQGYHGRLMEFDTAGTLIWEYTISQSGHIFRTEKYPADFPGFEGRDMTGSGEAANIFSNYECELFVDTVVISNSVELNEETTQIRYLTNRDIQVINSQGYGFSYTLFDTQGRQHKFGESNSPELILSLEGASPGLYILQIKNEGSDQWLSSKILIR